MIARIDGTLQAMDGQAALIRPEGGLTYEVLVPAFTLVRLAGQIGAPVTLHTLAFLESQGQGATFVPRLAGFLSAQDKAFYELFVTCKGIGYRRALRAMTLATPQIAAAIADRDIATLQSLPEIGKRTAETLTVTLRDKVDPFTAPEAGADQPTARTPATQATDNGAETTRSGPVGQEALEALVSLGENRAESLQWVDQVLAQSDPPTTAEAVLTEVYRLKSQAGR